MVDKLLLSIKCFSMVGVNHSLCHLSPAPGLLVWFVYSPAELLLLTGEGAKADPWRHNHMLRADGAR